MEPIIKLELSLPEVNWILTVLGDLPTKSNAHPLLVKLAQQAEAQLPKQDPAPAEAAAAAE